MQTKWIAVGIIILFGLVLAACGGSSSPGDGPIQVTTQNLRFNPDTLTVKAGQKVTVDLTNKDSFPHTFEIEGVEGAGIGLPPGSKATLEFTIDQPGTYTIFCGVGDHRERGMVGQLTVQP